MSNAKCKWCGKDFTSTYRVNKVVNDYCSKKCYTEDGSLSHRRYEGQSSCFIATATFNNYNHPVVHDLQNFRDNWLIKKKWGKSFVLWYYKKGPLAAKLISKSNLLRFFSFIIIIKPIHFLIMLFRLHKRTNI